MEIINEDSFFFWTFNKNSIPGQHWSTLEEIYNKWLDKKQPQQAPHKRKLYDAWHMTRDGIKKTGGSNNPRNNGSGAFPDRIPARFL